MLTVNIMIIYKITNKINQKIYKCKIFDLVLEKYKYLFNTVPSAEMQKFNDYSPRKEI